LQLLLEHGADPNAKTQQGATPLLVAASANGTAGVIALLLDKGAEPDTGDNRGVTPLIAAAGVGNTAAAKLLLQHGALATAYAPGIGQKTATPLMGAAHNGDVELARLILAHKPDVDVKAPDNDGTVKNGPVAFGSFTALHLATAAGSADLVKLLLDAGAMVDARDVRDLTPLSWAVASDRPQPQIVRLLLERGANPSLTSKESESTLDWAKRFNNPIILRELKLTAAVPATQDSAVRAVPASLTPQEAVERSLPLLRKASAGVMGTGGCVACHAQPMSGMATELASHRGWRAEPATAELTQVTASSVAATAGYLQGRESGGLPDTQLYGAFMMMTMNAPPSVATDAFVYYLIAKQRLAGNWHGIATRAPMQDGDISRTALAIRTLAVYGMPAR
jgi:ankyrin repeat protein